MKRKDESGKDQKRGGNSFCKKKEEEERKEERRYHDKDEKCRRNQSRSSVDDYGEKGKHN